MSKKTYNSGEPSLGLELEEETATEQKDPVTVLGLTFANDDERREYFRAELRRKLPELRNIEGFPIGEDDDIIALSDPPYYTACPNLGSTILSQNGKQRKRPRSKRIEKNGLRGD